MDGAEDFRRAAAERAPRTVDTFLAGLQAGTLGVLWMLAWMGSISAWQRRSFWTPENLIASAFHPNDSIRVDFGWGAVTGLALYLLLYGLLGGGFAMLVARRQLRAVRVTLLALAFALAWHLFSFFLFWKAVSPAIVYLRTELSTVVGHIIYGIFVGRFHMYYPPAEIPPPETATEQETTPNSVAPSG
jgi:hypothetical protein